MCVRSFSEKRMIKFEATSVCAKKWSFEKNKNKVFDPNTNLTKDEMHQVHSSGPP